MYSIIAAATPDNMPSWITDEYLEKCRLDKEMQESWTPKEGDFFFCKDLYQIMQIADLDEYYKEGSIRSMKDSPKNAEGQWECDIYLPEPPTKYVVRVKPGLTLDGLLSEMTLTSLPEVKILEESDSNMILIESPRKLTDDERIFPQFMVADYISEYKVLEKV